MSEPKQSGTPDIQPHPDVQETPARPELPETPGPSGEPEIPTTNPAMPEVAQPSIDQPEVPGGDAIPDEMIGSAGAGPAA